MERKLRVLAMVDYYLPGFRGGGPAQSVSRLIARCRDRIEFSLLTRDRDLGGVDPYDEISAGKWFEKDDVAYFYARPEQLSRKAVLRAVREAAPDVLYLNSYFSKLTRIVLWARRTGKLPGVSVLVAPRGEFSSGALRLKALKKWAYLRLAAAFGLHRRIAWHVSTEHEERDVRAAVGTRARCLIRPPDTEPAAISDCRRPAKRPGEARFVFVSRISPKKNLHQAIELLAGLSGQASLTIVGPIEDEAYWERCQEAAARLPEGVTCEHVGPASRAQVAEWLAQSHFFLFPTLGENFGHVIAEALAARCPVLVSDRTPWQDLDRTGAGWVLPLEAEDAWRGRMQSCLEMDEAAFALHAEAARAFAEAHAVASKKDDPAELFRAAA
jgi:glycosyltransferase involved in cell wall biosynthesis